MDNSDYKKLIESYVECYNAFDVDGMMRLLSDTVVFENESAGEINARAEGKAEFKDLADQSAKLFSSRSQKVTSIEPIGEVWIAHISYEATIAVDLPNGLKKGQSIELSGRSEFRFENGKICHIKDIA